MRRIHFISLAIALIALGGAYLALADEGSDALAKAPAPVQATAKKLIGENKIGEISKEVSDGKIIYDVEFSIKGVTYALDIDASGNLLSREVDIDVSVLPPTVVEAVKKAHPTGTIGETAIVTEGDKMYYGMEVKAGTETRDVEVSAGGTIIADVIAPTESSL